MLGVPGFYVGPSWLYLGAILGLCWVLLGRLGPMLTQLGTMLGVPGFYVGPSWLYLGAILGPCWVLLGRLGPMLAQLGTMLGVPGFYVGPSWLCVGAILGHVARCSKLTPCNSPQRAVFTIIYSVFCTFPTSKSPCPLPSPHGSLCWAFLGSLLGHLGISWPILGLCWAFLGSMLGHLGSILGQSWDYVGFCWSSWAYVGPAWDYVGHSWVLCWAILALCWPILGHVARCSNLTPCNSPQRAVFTVIYSVFFAHFQHPNHPAPRHPPPMAPYVGRSWVLCWAILALSWGHLGSMFGFVGSSWAYVGPAWDYVGRSWALCWAIFALCWPILGHVARCSNLTPWNSPQRAVFIVIYNVFSTFPTSKSPCPPPSPPAWLLMLGVPGFYVGPSWLHPGAILGLCWVLLGRLGPMLAQLGTMLGHLGSVLAYLGACCAMQQLDSL